MQPVTIGLVEPKWEMNAKLQAELGILSVLVLEPNTIVMFDREVGT
jgi:hypothetical protein